MDLKEWTVHYIKQKDMMTRDLISYKEEENKVLCEYKEGRKATFYCQENLELDQMKKIPENETSTFVCLCNEHNFKVLVDNWDLFKTKKNMTFMFLNPDLAEKWVIKPFVHAKIADPITLKQGLRTMYETCMGTSKD
jgi:hypothetical protein